jgi:phosphatidylserine decarboxylase
VIRSRLFLRGYHLLPHGLLNGGVARLMRLRRPRRLVRAGIARWIARDQIDMRDFQARDFTSLEDFFLRELRPGARPLGPGLVAPVDGRVVAAGAFDAAASLDVKGCRLSLDRVVNGADTGRARLPLDDYQGGAYASLFLSPRGYHHVHMPADGALVEARWLPGRYFPQNDTALRHIAGVYERNERLTLRLRLDGGEELLMVMVGASLVGGIELDRIERRAFTRPAPLAIGRRLAKGDRLGHFRFGSTVIVVLRPSWSLLCAVGADVRMGEPLAQRVSGAR